MLEPKDTTVRHGTVIKTSPTTTYSTVLQLQTIMGLADRKRRRSIRENALPDNIESADDVGKEVSNDEDEALASLSDEFFDSPVSVHHAPVVPAAPTGKHVTVLNYSPFFPIKFYNANDLVELCSLN
jgi:hypothetical protein